MLVFRTLQKNSVSQIGRHSLSENVISDSLIVLQELLQLNLPQQSMVHFKNEKYDRTLSFYPDGKAFYVEFKNEEVIETELSSIML